MGEAADYLAVHAELAGDPAQSHAPGLQGLDGGVLVSHPVPADHSRARVRLEPARPSEIWDSNRASGTLRRW